MKVAIAGYGVEGEASYRYYASRGDDVTIVDESLSPGRSLPDGATAKLGPGIFSELNGFDLVVRTASLRPDKITTDGSVWSATNEFFANCPAPIIGVTGTKGKGTTCGLIASILEAAGHTVHLVGNIGTPALDVLPSVQAQDVVVFELSSFQLWDLKRSPDIAVVLMIEPDHLDVHMNFDEYLKAKHQIVASQKPSDIAIYHPTNQYSKQLVEGAQAFRYGIADDGQVYIEGNSFKIHDREICSTDSVQLPGLHNIENACAAMSAAMAYDAAVSNEQFSAGLSSFTGLPHRLKFVREVDGVKYYDDSIATTPGSAIAALRAFDESKVVILGGSDKGADYQSIVDECKAQQARVVAIGQTGEKIAELCRASEVEVVRETGLMPEVVARAHAIAHDGDVVILSPASASFGQYVSYVDRGEQFVAAVEAL